MCYVSQVTCQVSHVTHFFFYKVVKLDGEGSVINRAPSSFFSFFLFFLSHADINWLTKEFQILYWFLNGLKWLKFSINDCKWKLIARIGWKWLKMAGGGWKSMDMAENVWTWLEMLRSPLLLKMIILYLLHYYQTYFPHSNTVLPYHPHLFLLQPWPRSCCLSS